MKKIKKKIQNYWDKQPCNIKHSKKKFLSKEYFNKVKKKDILLNLILKNLQNLRITKIKMSLKSDVA
mgnify:CR=1 FL=1